MSEIRGLAERTHLSSSDDQLVQEMDTTDPFRQGWPKLKTLPLISVAASKKDISILHELNLSIRDILERRELRIWTMEICHRTRPAESPTTDETSLTLLIIIDGDSGSTMDSIKATRKLLKLKNYRITIEMIRKSSHPDQPMERIIAQEHAPLAEFWAQKKTQVIEAVRDSGWVSMDIILFGPEGACVPTLIIGCEDADDQAWVTRAHRIEAIIGQYLRLVLRWSPQLLSTFQRKALADPDIDDPSDAALMINAKDIGTTVYLGASLGAHGHLSSGTLAGCITLKKGDDELEVGLTNSHVVEGDEESTCVKATANKKPTSGSLADSLAIGVKSPSDLDISVKRTEAQQNVNRLHSKPDPSTETQQLATAGMHDASARAKQMQTDLATYEEELQLLAATEPNRHCGTIFAGSGRRILQHGPYSLPAGWALIRPSPQPRISNAFRGIQYNRTLRRLGLAENDEVGCWRPFHVGQDCEVMKKGRSTGWTCGRTNGIESIVLDKDEGVVHGVLILGSDSRAFARSGDSGAFVIEKPETKEAAEAQDSLKRRVVGLFFAANPCDTRGYMLPIQEVFADIEKVTGWEVKQEWQCTHHKSNSKAHRLGLGVSWENTTTLHNVH